MIIKIIVLMSLCAVIAFRKHFKKRALFVFVFMVNLVYLAFSNNKSRGILLTIGTPFFHEIHTLNVQFIFCFTVVFKHLLIQHLQNLTSQVSIPKPCSHRIFNQEFSYIYSQS